MALEVKFTGKGIEQAKDEDLLAELGRLYEELAGRMMHDGVEVQLEYQIKRIEWQLARRQGQQREKLAKATSEFSSHMRTATIWIAIATGVYALATIIGLIWRGVCNS